jgi:hypothetical protein
MNENVGSRPVIGPARDDDREAIWRIPVPMIRAGQTYSPSRQVAARRRWVLVRDRTVEFARRVGLKRTGIPEGS